MSGFWQMSKYGVSGSAVDGGPEQHFNSLLLEGVVSRVVAGVVRASLISIYPCVFHAPGYFRHVKNTSPGRECIKIC